MNKILYADDDPKYRRLVELFLKKEGFQVYLAENGFELIDLFDKHRDATLIILDVMMPEMDGFETCQFIRTFSTVPVLMLTALGEVHDEVKGLGKGADEYISKPFSNAKLIARIEALIRRYKRAEEKLFQSEGYTLNETDLTIRHEKINVKVTQKEFDLLKELLLNKNRILSREKLLNKVWGVGYEGDPRTLDTHIKSLRQKLGQQGSRIKTRRGQGYYYRSENINA